MVQMLSFKFSISHCPSCVVVLKLCDIVIIIVIIVIITVSVFIEMQ